MKLAYVLLILTWLSATHESRNIGKGKHHQRNRFSKRRRPKDFNERKNDEISLWIDQQQVKAFSGYLMNIFVIYDGKVMPYVLDPTFDKKLPMIPHGVEQVNFTWKAGTKRYLYEFFNLITEDEELLKRPTIDIPRKGVIPRRKDKFSVLIKCRGNVTGITRFSIALSVIEKNGNDLKGTPLHFSLKKECIGTGYDQECDDKCSNGGVCDINKKCRCPEGYMGTFCTTALCYPQCRNGGFCASPGKCSCSPGFHGRYCEGGICRDKCLNGGKCIQKDTCKCKNGFYGNRCEYSKCVIPCINGGKCKGVNKCRCSKGYKGDHCEIMNGKVITKILKKCAKNCKHGKCNRYGVCKCHKKYGGKWCKRSLILQNAVEERRNFHTKKCKH